QCKKIKLSYGVRSKEDDYIFISVSDGQPVYGNYINDFFSKIYEQIDMKEITPHGLRHTHATILIDMLVPPTDIANRLGYSLEMVYDYYAHAFEKGENKTVSAFSNGLIGAKFVVK